MTTKIDDVLKTQFHGFKELRGIQRQVIENVINNGSTLAIAPTGSGKSLMYWVSARVLGGVCVVISPLIALIAEQTQKLTELGFNVLSFHSSKNAAEKKKDAQTLISFAKGISIPDFIFVSPERIATDGFLEYCFKLQSNKISLCVIDEVHCISQWGFDFRPFYKRIPDFLNRISKDKWPVILAMTATINPREMEDVCTELSISHNSVIRDVEQPLRHDIIIHVEKYVSEDEKRERLFDLLKTNKGKQILVYLYRKYDKNGVEELCETARETGILAACFHGDMDINARTQIINDYKNGKIEVIFATNAFGMGIDIPNIRVVIHYMLPESVEQFYQEIGRAGRDKLGANAYLLYSTKNIQVRKQFYIDKSFLSEREIINEYNKQFHKTSGIVPIQLFEENKFASIFNNILDCGALEFVAKGIAMADNLTNIKNSELLTYIESVKYKSIFKIATKNNLTISSLMHKLYKAYLNGEVSYKNSVAKCIFINSIDAELTSEHLTEILKMQNERKEYKHNLLDYFVYLLDNYENTTSFHQEIGNYLGVPKFSLGKIYATEKGDMVRSKSEVIIANILFRSGIDYIYEQPLQCPDKQIISPDFTIYHNGRTFYWEHLGLLGKSDYDKNWKDKYERYKSMQLLDFLITTEENPNLSKIVNYNIEMLSAK